MVPRKLLPDRAARPRPAQPLPPRPSRRRKQLSPWRKPDSVPIRQWRVIIKGPVKVRVRVRGKARARGRVKAKAGVKATRDQTAQANKATGKAAVERMARKGKPRGQA